jgi:MFS family permease
LIEENARTAREYLSRRLWIVGRTPRDSISPMTSASPRRVLFMVSVLHGATHLYTTFLQALNSDLKLYFGLTFDEQVTRIATVYFICYASCNLLGGLLVSRVAPRTLLAVGPIVNGIAVGLMYFLQPHQYAGLLLLNALGAMGGGLYHPVGNLLLTETFPAGRGKALGISGAGASIAFIFAPFAASSMVRFGVCSWQGVCLLFGAIGVACGVAAWLLLPAGQPHAMLRVEPAAAGHRRTVRSAMLFAGLMILVCAGREISSWGTTSITQQFTKATYAEPVDAGLLLSLIFLPGLLIQPLAGRWSDIIGREKVLSGAFFCAALSLILIPLMPRALVYLPYLLFGASMLATVPTTDALLADRMPPALRGLAFGVVITAAFGSGAMGPLIVGKVADWGGNTPSAYRWSFWTLACFSMSSCILGLLLMPFARWLKMDSVRPIAPVASTAPEPSL